VGWGMLAARKLKGADGVRGLACLLVLCVHSVAIIYPKMYPYLIGCGKIGVWLFFVLSAFLLSRKLIACGFNHIGMIDYAFGRFLRIYPPFFVTVLIYYAFNTADIKTSSDVFSALLLHRGYFHLWTIPVEFKAYAILPFLAFAFYYVGLRQGAAAVVIACILAILGHQIIWPYWHLPESSTETVWYLPSFAIGAACAVTYDVMPRSVSDRTRAFAAVAVLTGVALSTPLLRAIALGQAPTNDLMNKFLFFSLAWGAFVMAVVEGQTALHVVFARGFLPKVGEWSYSVYLLHWLFVARLGEWLPERASSVAVAIVASLIAGAAMHHVLEKPCEELRRMFSSGLLRRANHGLRSS
jgi:peptidoglycan/LPS O-acetylase OafA/YrhL